MYFEISINYFNKKGELNADRLIRKFYQIAIEDGASDIRTTKDDGIQTLKSQI